MSLSPDVDWPALRDACVRFKSDRDEFFDAEQIEAGRRKEWDVTRKIVEMRLAKIAGRGRFHSWVALFQPDKLKHKYPQPILSREEAEPHYEPCDELMSEAVAFARSELGMALQHSESSARKLTYDLRHPPEWDAVRIGTSVQALLSYQGRYLVKLIPEWVVGRGGELKLETGDWTETLQAMWDVEDAVNDFLGHGGFGNLGQFGNFGNEFDQFSDGEPDWGDLGEPW